MSLAEELTSDADDVQLRSAQEEALHQLRVEIAELKDALASAQAEVARTRAPATEGMRDLSESLFRQGHAQLAVDLIALAVKIDQALRAPPLLGGARPRG